MLIISIIIFISFVGIFTYLLNVIKNKNNHISRVTETLEQKLSEKENVASLEEKMLELKDIDRRIQNFLVDPSSIDTFVEFIENLGVANAVELSVTNVDVPKGEKNKILISISIKGEFSQIMRIINIIENAPYNISIVSAYINKEIKSAVEPISASREKEIKPAQQEKTNLWQADLIFSVLSVK